jgi:hypothetical protein
VVDDLLHEFPISFDLSMGPWSFGERWSLLPKTLLLLLRPTGTSAPNDNNIIIMVRYSM